MALAGEEIRLWEMRILGRHLSLSWHHTRSFRQRSRVESEQSCGSFVRRTVPCVEGCTRPGNGGNRLKLADQRLTRAS
jgi:hypothetical protein